MKVRQFYNDDRVSVNMPGIKDYVSIRDQDNKRVHVQKRLVLSNLKELFHYFREENSNTVIGFSLFASLRPKNCVLAGASGTHTVCVCSIHQNVKLMIIGKGFIFDKRLLDSVAISNISVDHFMNFKLLRRMIYVFFSIGSNLKVLTRDSRPLNHYTDCLKFITCPNSSPKCYFGTCTACPGIEVLRDYLDEVLNENEIDSITYKHWVSTPRTSLETAIKEKSEFVDDFCEKIKILLPHSFIAKAQSTFLKSVKESLNDNEFLVQCDFAENYAFVVQEAAPGFHWNNSQATIYPVVVYFKSNGVINHSSLVIISDCLNHDSIAVHVFSKIITDFIKSINATASKIYYCSDGAPQQFKNYKNILNVYHHKFDYGIYAEWHYFPTAHGKGGCDGVGGTMKRMAARASLQLPPDRQITTPQALFDWASQSTNLPNIVVKFSPKSDYDRAKDMLENRFKIGKPIPGTQKIHCVLPQPDGTVFVKPFSACEEHKCHKILKNN